MQITREAKIAYIMKHIGAEREYEFDDETDETIEEIYESLLAGNITTGYLITIINERTGLDYDSEDGLTLYYVWGRDNDCECTIKPLGELKYEVERDGKAAVANSIDELIDIIR